MQANVKDTISADKQDDEVDADEDSGHAGSTVCHYTIIHDSIPILSCKNLKESLGGPIQG